MNKSIIAVFGILLCSLLANAQNAKPTTLEWHDSVRDVLIDGDLDRNAQVITSDAPTRLVLLSPKFSKALVLNIEDKSVNVMTKEAFKFSADQTSATSDASQGMQATGKFIRVDGANSSFVYTFTAEGKMIVIRSHPGLTGEMTEEKLWQTVPVWHAKMEIFNPNPQAVAAIKAMDKETHITLIFGTWCGDSKNYIPRLLKTLHLANNAKLKLKLIGIDNQFNQPVDVVQPRKLINVPTVIVERDGREIGRIIETPATANIEEDLAAILNEKPLRHEGRWERGAKLGRGVYSYRDASGKEIGQEHWELFAGTDGGYLVHSRITTGDLTTEVFHEVDAKKNPTFIEVTKTSGGNITRTRYNIEAHTLSATMRGSTSGVVKQTLEVPSQLAVSSPSVAAEGLFSAQVKQGEIVGYVVPRDFVNTTGTLLQTSNETQNDETVKTPAGEFRTQHLLRKSAQETSEWWLHSQLGIPVRGRMNGKEFVLTALEIAPKN
ncbi:MAG: thioredoxin family protein [Acidobacteria bacterium]|nr:thioredoxin family protein [Acidobacteriota bacterium]